MSGYFYRIADIDLSSGNVADYPIDHQYYRDYIGGGSLAARLFFDLVKPCIDPLSIENPLFIMTGPLVGTGFPGSSRFAVCAKSPLTGIWGESTCGGAFGVSLRKNGFDGIIIRGRASQPVVVEVFDGSITIGDATNLWGLDTYEAAQQLKEVHSDRKKLRTLTIGPAGEHRVRYASICHDRANHLGRTGMGAIMGSKNLKAIIAEGTVSLPIADEEEYKSARKTTLEAARESIVSISLNQAGTASAMEIGMMTGDIPIKNWRVGEVEELGDELGGNAIVEKILKKRKACQGCPIACKPEVKVENTKYDFGTGPGPEYETLGTFGSMLMSLDLDAISKANDLCNRLGLDSISCGATIAFIMEAREKGFYSDEQLDHLDLTWGNLDAVIELLKKISYREGFGDMAAEGSAVLAENLPEQAREFLVTIKGLELPMHDPRGFHGMGLAYMMSNRGACHLQHSVQSVEQCSVSWPEAGLEDEYTGTESEGKAKMVYISEGIGQMANAICLCHFAQWAIGLENTLAGLNAVTGFELSLEDYINIGHRSWLLKRSLNNLMGVREQDDKLPGRVLTPLDEGGTGGTIPDEALLKFEYYQIRDLDPSGIPSEPALLKADLGFLIEPLKNMNS